VSKMRRSNNRTSSSNSSRMKDASGRNYFPSQGSLCGGCTFWNVNLSFDLRNKARENRSQQYCKPRKRTGRRSCWRYCCEARCRPSSLSAKARPVFADCGFSDLSVFDRGLANEVRHLRWVPHTLTAAQKAVRVELTQRMLQALA
jgi:hypothetical protein